MTLSEVFRGLGRERFDAVLKAVSMGALKTYQVYETFKIRTHLSKLNRDRLRKAGPRLWERLEAGDDDDLARELAQGALVSNLDLVVDVLDFLEIPHDGNGFFDKDASAEERLTDGWQERAVKEFKEKHPEPLLLLYLNHLHLELGEPENVFLG